LGPMPATATGGAPAVGDGVEVREADATDVGETRCDRVVFGELAGRLETLLHAANRPVRARRVSARID
jgi:hypothetical protein